MPCSLPTVSRLLKMSQKGYNSVSLHNKTSSNNPLDEISTCNIPIAWARRHSFSLSRGITLSRILVKQRRFLICRQCKQTLDCWMVTKPTVYIFQTEKCLKKIEGVHSVCKNPCKWQEDHTIWQIYVVRVFFISQVWTQKCAVQKASVDVNISYY